MHIPMRFNLSQLARVNGAFLILAMQPGIDDSVVLEGDFLPEDSLGDLDDSVRSVDG